MASINASTSGAGGVITTADNTGILNIQTASTTALTIDASQRAAFVAGTAALPAITTTGDTNTGMFFPAADTIAFAEGGVEAMRLNSSGNVGIGTSSPTAKLHVQDGAVLINNGSSAGTVYFVDTNAYINYVGSTMQFGVNSLERMRINSVGSRLYTNFNTGDINTGEATINFSNVSSTTFDISTLFPQVGGTGSGVSINIQVQTWNGGSNSGVSVIGNGARATSSWAWTTINNTNTGGASATVTFSGSGNIVTITFSGGGQYGKAKISLIATS